MTERFSIAELREAATDSRTFPPVLMPPELLALVEAVEAARNVRTRHPFNAESAVLVLDRCLARFDFGDQA